MFGSRTRAACDLEAANRCRATSLAQVVETAESALPFSFQVASDSRLRPRMPRISTGSAGRSFSSDSKASAVNRALLNRWLRRRARSALEARFPCFLD